MSDELPDDVTVSMRVESAPVALPGHEKRDCLKCGEAVIVNPATLEAIADGIYPEAIACLECATEAAQ